MTKTRQDNNMSNCIGAIYTKNVIKLSWLIRLSVVWDKTREDDMIDYIGVVYA